MLSRQKYTQQNNYCLSPMPFFFLVEMAVEKPKRHKSPDTDQNPTERIKAGGRTIRSEIHKLINSVWNREELPEEWKDSIIVPIYEKGGKTDCSNYGGISRVHNFIHHRASRLTPCAGEINGNHQCGFRRSS